MVFTWYSEGIDTCILYFVMCALPVECLKGQLAPPAQVGRGQRQSVKDYAEHLCYSLHNSQNTCLLTNSACPYSPLTNPVITVFGGSLITLDSHKSVPLSIIDCQVVFDLLSHHIRLHRLEHRTME